MPPTVDFSNPGSYNGDIVEETFKPFSRHYMPFWWHFREVLRPGQNFNPYWKKVDGTDLTDDEQKELIALSLTNYHVYTSMAEAVTFFDQMNFELNRNTLNGWRLFEVRKVWKAMYSSLNTSFNALCNIICVVVGQKGIYKKTLPPVRNYDPGDAEKILNKRGITQLIEPFVRCKERMKIRQHLDHYWLIWHSINQGDFFIDKNFNKGYVPIRQEELSIRIPATKLAERHLRESARDFNMIYQEMSMQGGYLDSYFSAKNWMIDYSDYGVHNNQRPMP